MPRTTTTTWIARDIKNEVAPPILDENHPACGRFKDFRWSYVKQFPLDAIKRLDKYGDTVDVDTYVYDLETYLKGLKSEYRLGEADWLRDIYLPYPDRMPIGIVRGKDGNYYLWDGDKRVGMTLLQGARAIPAFVGE